jgi:hypothetical protein
MRYAESDRPLRRLRESRYQGHASSSISPRMSSSGPSGRKTAPRSRRGKSRMDIRLSLGITVAIDPEWACTDIFLRIRGEEPWGQPFTYDSACFEESLWQRRRRLRHELPRDLGPVWRTATSSALGLGQPRSRICHWDCREIQLPPPFATRNLRFQIRNLVLILAAPPKIHRANPWPLRLRDGRAVRQRHVR